MTRVARFLSRTPVVILLTVVALLWFMPILGLLVQSLRSAADVASSGWWVAPARRRSSRASARAASVSDEEALSWAGDAEPVTSLAVLPVERTCIGRQPSR